MNELHAGPVVIRLAVPVDADAIARLAALDSARPPRGDALVAEVGGEAIAAVGIEDGRAVADPFRPTEDVVRLLELRAAQLREAAGVGRGPTLRAPAFRALARRPA